MFVAEMAAIPNSKLVPLGFGFGLETALQLVPFQCATPASVSDGGRPFAPPAAQALVGESTATARSERSTDGAATRLQLVPSKWRITAPPTEKLSPTAHTWLLASAEMPLRMSLAPVKAGLETRLQLVPSQCSTRSPEKSSRNPTAQASVDEMAVTAVSAPPFESFGLETTFQ